MKRTAPDARRTKRGVARAAGSQGPEAPARSGPGHALPGPADLDMPALLQGAFVAGVGLGPVVSELDLDLVVREVAGAGTPALGGERVRLRFRAVENIQQLAALLLQRRLKSVGEFVDQVLSVGRTTTGWTLHFRRAGQVPIQTQQDPALVREEAG